MGMVASWQKIVPPNSHLKAGGSLDEDGADAIGQEPLQHCGKTRTRCNRVDTAHRRVVTALDDLK
jgi:hypothetical protein